MAGNTALALTTSHDTSDPLGNVFEPDVMLPSQFFSRECGLTGGERRLMVALLSDGIQSYIENALQPTRRRSPKQEEALAWVDTHDESYVFGFDSVCRSLGIEPEYLRRGLTRYVENMRMQILSGNRPAQVWKKIRRPRKK